MYAYNVQSLTISLGASSNSTSAGPDSWPTTQVIQAVLEAGECDSELEGDEGCFKDPCLFNT